MWGSPNVTIRNILDCTIFREHILCKNAPRIAPHWNLPVVVARHGYGNPSRATDFFFDGPGTLNLSFTPRNGGASIERQVFQAPSAGVVMAMYNLDESIRGAHSRALSRLTAPSIWHKFCRHGNTIKRRHGTGDPQGQGQAAAYV